MGLGYNRWQKIGSRRPSAIPILRRLNQYQDPAVTVAIRQIEAAPLMPLPITRQHQSQTQFDSVHLNLSSKQTSPASRAPSLRLLLLIGTKKAMLMSASTMTAKTLPLLTLLVANAVTDMLLLALTAKTPPANATSRGGNIGKGVQGMMQARVCHKLL